MMQIACNAGGHDRPLIYDSIRAQRRNKRRNITFLWRCDMASRFSKMADARSSTETEFLFPSSIIDFIPCFQPAKNISSRDVKFIYGSVERNDDDEFNIGIKTLICPVSVRRARLTGRLGAINRSKIKNRSGERCTIYIHVCVCIEIGEILI